MRLEDLFGFGMELLEGIKKMPALWALYCESIPKDVGMEIKKQLREKLDILTVTKLRDEDWLKENTEYPKNPLSHWDGSEYVPPVACKKAFQCYKNTRKQLLEAVNRQEVLHIVQTYTEQFNQLNEKYEEFIETEEREDIFAAMKQLFEDCITERFTEREIDSENSMDITLEEVYNVMEKVRRDW